MAKQGIERKTLLIGRHGEAPQKPEGGSYDVLTEDAFKDLYQKGESLRVSVLDHSYTPDRTFLVHTPKQRTKHTGQILLIRAYGMQPGTGNNPPGSAEDLENYDGLSLIDTQEDPRLIYGHHFDDGRDDFNIQLYKQFGAQPGIDFMLTNPDAEEHDGEKIVPGRILFSDTYNAASENIKRVLTGEKDLGVIISHGGRAEGMLIPLINSAGRKQIQAIDDIGGTWEMGESAKLIIDMHNSNAVNATVTYKGQPYKVDINEFMNNAPGRS